MNFTEAVKESNNRKWVLGEWDDPWFGVITCEPPIFYTDNGKEHEYQVLAKKENAEIMIEAHNRTYGGNK